MTKFAQLWLVLTSLAPIAFVDAAVSLDHHQTDWMWTLIAVATLLVVLCELLVRGLRKWLAAVPMEVKEPAARDAEPLAFLVAYALPLVSAKSDGGSRYGLAVFGVLMVLAVWQLQIVYINPLFAVLGYHFINVKANDGTPVVVITRTKTLAAGPLPIVKISDYLWLHHPKAGGGRGSTSSNTKRLVSGNNRP